MRFNWNHIEQDKVDYAIKIVEYNVIKIGYPFWT